MRGDIQIPMRTPGHWTVSILRDGEPLLLEPRNMKIATIGLAPRVEALDRIKISFSEPATKWYLSANDAYAIADILLKFARELKEHV